jgi:dCMP deaminase
MDRLRLKSAYQLARNQSTDTSTKLGAILYSDKFAIGQGVNRLPKGVLHLPERLERPLKYEFTEHAERNAIYDAARHGFPTDKAKLYAPWFACTDCGRAIIEAGIKEVIGHAPIYRLDKRLDGRKDWQDSIEKTLQMFREAKVKFRWIDDFLDEKVFFNGEWHIV